MRDALSRLRYLRDFPVHTVKGSTTESVGSEDLVLDKDVGLWYSVGMEGDYSLSLREGLPADEVSDKQNMFDSR